jgi:hypothetical protein
MGVSFCLSSSGPVWALGLVVAFFVLEPKATGETPASNRERPNWEEI